MTTNGSNLTDEPVSSLVADRSETRMTRRRYDRIAPVYDLAEWMMELWVRRWRRDMWSRLGDGCVLELGVGTGKSFRYHPASREIVAVDLSERMLRRAQRRSTRLNRSVWLAVADAQELPFADASFDVVAATFLFCSVPDPVRGLTEARRVLRPGGRLLLLEHVLSNRPPLRQLMRWLDPIPYHLWGAHIDRDTADNVSQAGFVDIEQTYVFADVVARIEALTPS